ncbi:bifunctional UDP-N-acetylglucosamine diphosphorylase/glucosamine-1-phosphate N-acetyltransferase GlmU [Ruminococcaceae bacterium OttesenSCG-928-L11]|nr:bifunctional UDP-N-acetylglucosamine diphosphorylase/glucosamine-1-phosphate N-acetyltransferase GlmU [Ruminococcaceae bacterium OttesenSCG-928-L11]
MGTESEGVQMTDACAVILAAGDGKRMKSAQPKVLCEVLFKPMIAWVVDSVDRCGVPHTCVVVNDSGKVEPVLPARVKTAVQLERRGTGHATKMAAGFIRECGAADVMVLCGDAPLVTGEDLAKAYALHKAEKNDVTVLSAVVDNSTGYGRIVREDGHARREDGQVTAIVEEADTDETTRLIPEINSGAFWFGAKFLLEALDKLQPNNAQGEYYLTDTLAYAVNHGYRAGACVVSPDAALGANSRKGLQQLNAIARERVLEKHLENGVDIPFADGIVIGVDVKIGPDTRILPGTILKGNTVIGAGCEIGPNSHITDGVVKDGSQIISSYIDSAVVEANVKIGPMSNIRPDSHIMDGVKIGDFVEIKNSTIGEKTSVAHLTYVGDSDVGKGCNFGCGVVTVNYDGTNKHRTVIGDHAFIGCNTNLVAPVRVGNHAYSAAGTTITEDVPDDALVIGRARQVVKEGWTVKTGKFRKK